MTTTSGVAVLIVNYRTYDALARCLTSLLPYCSSSDDVVVVDWASQPESVSAMAATFPRVRWLVDADNRGFAAGVNRAAASTSAQHLLLLNPDTVVEGPVLRTLEAWMETHPTCVVAGPRVLNADGTVQASARRFPGISTAFGGRSSWLTRRFPNNPLTRRNLLTGDGAQVGRVDWLAGSCFLTRRSVFTEVGGLDEEFFMYWEDADYCRRVTHRGGECHYVPTVAVRHVGGVSSAHNVEPSIRAFHRSAARLFRKHAGAARVLAPVVAAALFVRGEVKVRLARRLAARYRTTTT
jgi:GT2 family glycosyltransferase